MAPSTNVYAVVKSPMVPNFKINTVEIMGNNIVASYDFPKEQSKGALQATFSQSYVGDRVKMRTTPNPLESPSLNETVDAEEPPIIPKALKEAYHLKSPPHDNPPVTFKPQEIMITKNLSETHLQCQDDFLLHHVLEDVYDKHFDIGATYVYLRQKASMKSLATSSQSLACTIVFVVNSSIIESSAPATTEDETITLLVYQEPFSRPKGEKVWDYEIPTRIKSVWVNDISSSTQQTKDTKGKKKMLGVEDSLITKIIETELPILDINNKQPSSLLEFNI
nr:hypothetical protein [Tanacetum cinerariifolium]GEW97471.1 hypothetical protein [Tanacetum cinerariifolium]